MPALAASHDPREAKPVVVSCAAAAVATVIAAIPVNIEKSFIVILPKWVEAVRLLPGGVLWDDGGLTICR
jgi:hypothetical protein